MRYLSYLNTATQLIAPYNGTYPFGNYAKGFFAKNKKYGSSDRRHILKLCYSFFRAGQALKDLPTAERMIAGLFLCSTEPNELLLQLKPEWNSETGLSLEEKFTLISGGGDGVALLSQVFPWEAALHEGIAQQEFLHSFFVQPNLFLRARPGKVDQVKDKLTVAEISFEPLGDYCLAMPNASKADRVIHLNAEAVIQDYSSQRVGELFPVEAARASGRKWKVWDCCAGSGGKSIMTWDLMPAMELTVSDIRQSIIFNLKKRFEEAGIDDYTYVVTDLLDPKASIPMAPASCDLIIADVPCSGSGTWGRTPEELYYFVPDTIATFNAGQKKMVDRLIPYVAPGGYLLYITCSVFKGENEEVVEHIKANSPLQLERMELLKGYNRKADTLFAALFRAPQAS